MSGSSAIDRGNLCNDYVNSNIYLYALRNILIDY